MAENACKIVGQLKTVLESPVMLLMRRLPGSGAIDGIVEYSTARQRVYFLFVPEPNIQDE